MKLTRKPVKHCHGCGLNFGDHCGVYEVPHDMWHGRKCTGYKNEALLEEYKAEQARQQVDERKQKRREVAKRRDTKDHQDGTRHANGTLVIR